MTVVDRASPVPLWAQILADLRKRLGRGEFRQRFPTDEELRTHYGVSRQTVRDAVRRLQSEGTIVRERGRGSSAAPPELEQPLRSLYSLARTIQASGRRESSRVLRTEIAIAGPLANDLELNVHEEVVSIERLRLLDDEPLALERSVLPASRARDLLETDLTSGSLYDALRLTCGIEVIGGTETIQPVNPSLFDQRILRLTASEAVFRVDRLVHDATGPVERRESLIRGSRYAFRAEWPSPP